MGTILRLIIAPCGSEVSLAQVEVKWKVGFPLNRDQVAVCCGQLLLRLAPLTPAATQFQSLLAEKG